MACKSSVRNRQHLVSSPVESLSGTTEAAARANAEAGGVMSIGGDPFMPPVDIEAPPAPVKFEAMGKSALLFAGAALISKMLSFVMLPLYTHYLSVADYGALELVENSLECLDDRRRVATARRRLSLLLQSEH